MKLISWITDPINLIRTRYGQSYVVMNLLFYGFIGVGMLIAAKYPAVQSALTKSTQESLKNPRWSIVVDAYGGRHLLRAIAVTFAANFVLGTFVELSLPSLVIPFIGIVFGIFRAALWGLIFGPTAPGNMRILATHWPVMLLEGQGYALGMLSVYVHGKAVIKPCTVGAVRHLRGYRRGFVESMHIYPLIAVALAISALYEAWEVIYLVHR